MWKAQIYHTILKPKFNLNPTQVFFYSQKSPSRKWEGNYNDFHQPEGNWAQKNAEMQKKRNKTLVIGIGFFIASFLFGKFTGLWEHYDYYPDRPADFNDYTGGEKSK
ncbi:unnamed protein product [Diabrotica balteata]|uniref:Deltamethrin resistance protein prag01 domain-containing protein n=1 Tax=Diabrotica balteata TaxID=107213 RepID=A0A9N9TBA2_DIABA|nr:unnamed protein product [Diabrotica balteata]